MDQKRSPASLKFVVFRDQSREEVNFGVLGSTLLFYKGVSGQKEERKCGTKPRNRPAHGSAVLCRESSRPRRAALRSFNARYHIAAAAQCRSRQSPASRSMLLFASSNTGYVLKVGVIDMREEVGRQALVSVGPQRGRLSAAPQLSPLRSAARY